MLGPAGPAWHMTLGTERLTHKAMLTIGQITGYTSCPRVSARPQPPADDESWAYPDLQTQSALAERDRMDRIESALTSASIPAVWRDYRRDQLDCSQATPLACFVMLPCVYRVGSCRYASYDTFDGVTKAASLIYRSRSSSRSDQSQPRAPAPMPAPCGATM